MWERERQIYFYKLMGSLLSVRRTGRVVVLKWLLAMKLGQAGVLFSSGFQSSGRDGECQQGWLKGQEGEHKNIWVGASWGLCRLAGTGIVKGHEV